MKTVNPTITENKLIKEILKITNKLTGLTLKDLQTKSRKRELVEIKHITIYYVEKFTKFTHAEIGSMFNKDHSSINYAIKTFKNLKQQPQYLRKHKHLINHFEIILPKIINEFEIDNLMTSLYFVKISDFKYKTTLLHDNIVIDLNTVKKTKKEIIKKVFNKLYMYPLKHIQF